MLRKLIPAALLGIGLLLGQDQTPYKIGGDVTAPRLTSRIDPSYTPEASAAKLEGTVTLSVVVGTDGLAHDINVVKSLGSGLDEKAVEAIQKWQFEPGTKSGQPVPVRAQIEVNFRLK
jgi:TonB family protein